MTLVTTAAHLIEPGDLYVFSHGGSATVRRVYRTPSEKVRVTFTDPNIRYAPCEADSMHTIGRR